MENPCMTTSLHKEGSFGFVKLV